MRSAGNGKEKVDQVVVILDAELLAQTVTGNIHPFCSKYNLYMVKHTYIQLTSLNSTFSI